MSITLTKAVWRNSRAKGNARLVLLALASFVVEEKLRVGEAALAWPSQSTLAEMCGCSRSTVEEALTKLKQLGEIEDTGGRKWGRYKGTIVWEILVEFDPPEYRSAEERETAHLTDSRRTPPESGHLPDRFSTPDDRKPVTSEELKKKKEELEEERSGSPSAAPDMCLPDSDFSEDEVVDAVVADDLPAAKSTPTQQQQVGAELEAQLAEYETVIAETSNSASRGVLERNAAVLQQKLANLDSEMAA